MKIAFDVSERKYLYGLLKMFAHGEKDNRMKMFWAHLASRLEPNQHVAHLNRKEVELVLEILTKAVDTLNGSAKDKVGDDVEKRLRLSVVDQVLAGAREKLNKKLTENPTEGSES